MLQKSASLFCDTTCLFLIAWSIISKHVRDCGLCVYMPRWVHGGQNTTFCSLFPPSTFIQVPGHELSKACKASTVPLSHLTAPPRLLVPVLPAALDPNLDMLSRQASWTPADTFFPSLVLWLLPLAPQGDSLKQPSLSPFLWFPGALSHGFNYSLCPRVLNEFLSLQKMFIRTSECDFVGNRVIEDLMGLKWHGIGPLQMDLCPYEKMEVAFLLSHCCDTTPRARQLINGSI